MFFFLYALSFFFNCIYGFLLPIIPHLGESTAGVAFSAFLLAKLLWFLPSGWISDRIGHSHALSFALILQIAALISLVAFPHYAWLGRVLEGMALAQGTVSTFAYLRLLSGSSTEFQKSVSILLGTGGAGMILGPTIGYLIVPNFVVEGMWVAVALCCGFFFASFLRAKPKGFTASDTAEVQGGFLYFVLGLTLAKALGVGWEPNLAWWANHHFSFTPWVAGFSFFLLGLCFVWGSVRPHRLWLWSIFVGYALLEFSLLRESWAWWPAMVLFGTWYGTYVAQSVGALGWNRPERIGRSNSLWMLFTDLPMSFVPALLWVWRDPEAWLERSALALVLLLGAAILLEIGLKKQVISNS